MSGAYVFSQKKNGLNRCMCGLSVQSFSVNGTSIEKYMCSRSIDSVAQRSSTIRKSHTRLGSFYSLVRYELVCAPGNKKG
ncbi:hypothetical protein TSAR_007136 [Trichomalopsis sarcophagae]|uniref:Uncharacterized protein n=1 Tax=Trichomalopsis sarcophagae TaxID=543379 RepID=A0A232FDV3_9HYME|nr:hypothetical protein TSAR_007136 [Trichomalopsis sarcophagae]